MTQRLMGSLLMVAGTKVLEGALLLLPRGLGWTGYLCFQRTVEPLQAPVLFRMPRFDALWEDPQLHPPHYSPPRPTLANGGPLSVRMVCGRPYSRKALSRTGRETPGGGVLHSNRVDAPPVSRAEPALEVDAQVIGLLCLDKGLAPRRCPASLFTPAHQPSPVQQATHGNRGEPGNPRLPVSQPSYQVFGAPSRMRLPGRNQALGYRPLCLVRMLIGRTAQIPQSIQPKFGNDGPVYHAR